MTQGIDKAIMRGDLSWSRFEVKRSKVDEQHAQIAKIYEKRAALKQRERVKDLQKKRVTMDNGIETLESLMQPVVVKEKGKVTDLTQFSSVLAQAMIYSYNLQEGKMEDGRKLARLDDLGDELLGNAAVLEAVNTGFKRGIYFSNLKPRESAEDGRM